MALPGVHNLAGSGGEGGVQKIMDYKQLLTPHTGHNDPNAVMIQIVPGHCLLIRPMHGREVYFFGYPPGTGMGIHHILENHNHFTL